jgi:hypothetical protein
MCVERHRTSIREQRAAIENSGVQLEALENDRVTIELQARSGLACLGSPAEFPAWKSLLNRRRHRFQDTPHQSHLIGIGTGMLSHSPICSDESKMSLQRP